MAGKGEMGNRERRGGMGDQWVVDDEGATGLSHQRLG